MNEESCGFISVPEPGAFITLASEYANAAKTLEQKGGGTVNAVVLFLLRHALELYLKGLLQDIDTKTPGDLKELSHKLKSLLRENSISSGRAWQDGDLASLDECIVVWDRVDPRNVQFRYPYDGVEVTDALNARSISYRAKRDELIATAEKAFEVCIRCWMDSKVIIPRTHGKSPGESPKE